MTSSTTMSVAHQVSAAPTKRTLVRRKRFLWHPDDIESYYYSDDYFSDDDEDRAKMGRPHVTPMASLLNMDLSEYELLRFYNSDSSPLLVAATGDTQQKQGLWMANVQHLSTSNDALKQMCLVFASMHLGYNRNDSQYTMKGGIEHPKSEGPPNPTEIAGYTRLSDDVLEGVMILYTNAIKAHNKQITEMTLETYESVLLSSVLIYLMSMGLGSLVPLINFDGGADLFSIGRSIHDLTFIYTGHKPSPVVMTDIELEKDRPRLPREEDLWDIIEFVDQDPDYSSAEKRRVKHILTTELKNLINLLALDINHHSVSHIAAWCTFWTPGFFELLRHDLNTYALLFVCYWCGYAHMWHVLFWWGDRIQDDILHLRDNLPERVHHFLKWPLKACTRFDISYVDLLSGKMRDLYV